MVDYWKDVILSLQMPNVHEDTIFMDFWPKTQGKIMCSKMDDEDDFGGVEEMNEHYCGPLSK